MAGIPVQLAKATKAGSFGIFKWIAKNWYWLIFIVIILPAFITAIKTTVETQNPLYPFIELGLHITNADAVIYHDVQILREDPIKLIGMEKPGEGMWLKIDYGWQLTKVIWKFLSLIWLIFFPWIIVYKIIRLKQTSEPAKNAWKTIKIAIPFIIIINLALAILNLITKEIIYTFPENADKYMKLGIILWTTLPFHGVISLIQYLATLI